MKWSKMRGKKQYILAFTCAGVLLSGCVQSFAWSIPGVTKPFDPANYWTHDTISWPDSAPSPYTLKDIARNRGLVIDYQNLKPNAIKDVKAVADFAKRLEELLTELKNIARLGGQAADNFKTYLHTVQQGRTVIEDTAESGVFLADGSESLTMQVQSKSFDEKYLHLDAAYQHAFIFAKNEMNAYEDRAAVLKEAVQRVVTAEGRVAAGQTQTEIGAITAAEVRQRNRLIMQRNALMVLNNRAKNDEIIRAETNIRAGLAVQYYDPYHPTEYDRAVYTKSVRPGMPDFVD